MTCAASAPALRRRHFLAGAAAVALGGTVSAPRIARAADPFTQTPLPFDTAALEPVISGRTMELHYGRHHAGYFRTLNRLTRDTEFAQMSLEEVVRSTSGRPEYRAIFNNAGQAWNHGLYWQVLQPGGPARPGGDLAARIEESFGSVEAMRGRLIEAGSGRFGSGWVWLVRTGERLDVTSTANGDNPLAHGRHALLGVDVWEHAYYLDYQNRRGEYLAAVIDNALNWDAVAERL